MIPDKIPDDLQKVVDSLKTCKSKTDCLGQAYDLLSKKYRGYKLRTLFHWIIFFTYDVEKTWRSSGFLHCTKLNDLMAVLLVKSGWFKESDINKKWALIYFISPHQYLNVKIDSDHTVNVDLWAKSYGLMLGEYAYGFNT